MSTKTIIQLLQAGNKFSKTYRENAATDTHTVVSGVSIAALVGGALEACAVFGYPISQELILTVTGIVTAIGSQAIPWITHILEERRKAKQDEAIAKIAQMPTVERLTEELEGQKEEPIVAPPSLVVTDDTPIKAYISSKGIRHSATTSCNTVGEAKRGGWASAILETGVIIKL